MSEDADMLIRVRVRQMQIISGTLVLGAMIFLAVVVIVAANQAAPLQPAGWPGGQPLLTMVAIVFFIVQVAIVMTLPPARGRAAVRQMAAEGSPPQPGAQETDVARLLVLRQKTLILALAPLEASAFFGCLAYLMEHRVEALAVTAVAIVLMLLYFPTEGAVRSWLDRQTEALTQARMESSDRI
jgi:hypothetical protein